MTEKNSTSNFQRTDSRKERENIESLENPGWISFKFWKKKLWKKMESLTLPPTMCMHIVVCHSVQLLQQGFEATHKWQKQIYFFSSTHDGSLYQKSIH